MKEFYSTLDVSGICGVDPVTVARWCDRGELACYKTPGGHRRVRREDLAVFLRKHRMEVPPELERRAVRMLVVADDARLVAALRRRYGNHGGAVELLTASNGIEGLIQFGAHSPELVLLDLQAAGIDAMAVCRQIRECPVARARIIALLPEADAARARRALKAGAAACLHRPLDLKALDALVLPPARIASSALKS